MTLHAIYFNRVELPRDTGWANDLFQDPLSQTIGVKTMRTLSAKIGGTFKADRAVVLGVNARWADIFELELRDVYERHNIKSFVSCCLKILFTDAPANTSHEDYDEAA